MNDPFGRPADLLGAFDDNCVSGKECRETGAEGVVDGIVPRDEGCDKTDGLVYDLRS